MTIKEQSIIANSTNILKLRSSHPESLKEMIKIDLAKRLQDTEVGIQRTCERLKQFEDKYQRSTEENVCQEIIEIINYSE